MIRSLIDDEKALLVPLQGKGSERARSYLRRSYFPCIPARYVLAVMIGLGFTIVYGLRVNLSVAIVQMDNQTATVHKGSARVFDWTDSEQGWVLAAFFYGYLVSQLPGGWLAQKIGGKWVFGLGVVITSGLSMFTQLAANQSVWLLVALRVLEGLFEGVTFPSMYYMMGKWAPPQEKSKMVTIVYSGVYIGNVVSFPLSAVLCQYGFDGGWPSVFYIFGALGILWFALWCFLGYSSPATHPRISREERTYIESSIAETTEKQLPIPWLKMLTSPPVWGALIGGLCYTWNLYVLITCMPIYFKQTLSDLQANSRSIILNGVYSAIPYAALPVLVPLSGQFADFLRARYFSTVVVRKLFNTVAFVGSAIFLLLCGYLSTSTATAVTLLSLSVGISSLTVAGSTTNQLDIAPGFAGALNGITNTAATITGIIAPQVAKAIAVEPSSPKGSEAYLNTYRDEWRQVFIISAEIYVFGAIIFLILASGEKQPWADPKHSEEKKEKVLHESCTVEFVQPSRKSETLHHASLTGTIQ